MRQLCIFYCTYVSYKSSFHEKTSFKIFLRISKVLYIYLTSDKVSMFFLAILKIRRPCYTMKKTVEVRKKALHDNETRGIPENLEFFRSHYNDSSFLGEAR